MNFSITSGEQSLQVFTATLILSPFCSIQEFFFSSQNDWNRKKKYRFPQDKSTYDTVVDSFVDLSKEALPEDPPQNNVTPLNPVLDSCNKWRLEPVKVYWARSWWQMMTVRLTRSTDLKNTSGYTNLISAFRQESHSRYQSLGNTDNV